MYCGGSYAERFYGTVAVPENALKNTAPAIYYWKSRMLESYHNRKPYYEANVIVRYWVETSVIFGVALKLSL